METKNNEKSKNISIKDWIIIILIIIILLLTFGVGLYYHKYQSAQKQVVIWNDSTYIYKNKYNEEYLAKNTYILKAELLKKYSDELYKEYMALKDHPVVITKTKLVTKIDSVETIVHDVQFKDSLVSWSWLAQDKDYYKINGHSSVDLINSLSASTTIDHMEIDSKLTLNVIDNGEQLAVIAKTDNPYMKLDSMQSVVINPEESPTMKNYFKPKRWGLSVYLGVGVNCGYDPINNGVGLNIGPSAGIAVTYDLVQW